MAAYRRVYVVTCGLTAEDRDQLMNPSLISSMGLPLMILLYIMQLLVTHADKQLNCNVDIAPRFIFTPLPALSKIIGYFPSHGICHFVIVCVQHFWSMVI